MPMKQMLVAILAAALAGTAVSGHHSYAAYHTDRVIEVDGTIEAFEWINPHSLLKVKTADTLYTFEWRAPNALQRLGLTHDLLKAGDHVVLTGNPHREIEANGIVNLKSIRRAADGWRWPVQ
jgi:hypothetical protein